MIIPAVMALADGSLFHGESIGVSGSTVGEVVFNTAMTGYQEILTDPSYCRQLVTLTYPHIGNTGTTGEDDESARAFAGGLVVRDVPTHASNWRQQGSLGAFLQAQNLVAISGLDTRALTRVIRERGAQPGCILTGDGEQMPDVERAVAMAREFPGLAGMDLAKVVSTAAAYDWDEGCWRHPQDAPLNVHRGDRRWRVVAYDFGIKHNILRLLVEYGCEVTVVPAQTPGEQVLAMKPDGVFLSNGPGDPEPCDYAIKAIATLLAEGLPMFGICLGYQLLGLASGAATVKMKFGHHGANHPVLDMASGKVMITSQNHGFAIDEATLPAQLQPTHRSLFDDTLQGVERTDCPAFGFQGHPEASPGPHDIRPLFERFIHMMQRTHA